MLNRWLTWWTGSPDTRALIEQGIGAALLIGWGTLVLLTAPIDRAMRRRRRE